MFKYIFLRYIADNCKSLFGTSEGEWLHDKFAEMEAETGDSAAEGESDNQPSSTTEK